jgi:3-oxoacyl-[acyl-carrier protein] reductase
MTQLTQVHMVKARCGRIISLSSASALGNRGRANYSAAKAGIQGFTRTFEIKLRPLGITANSIAPGFIETAMTEVRSGSQ